MCTVLLQPGFNPITVIISYHIISYHIISYHIISYHIISYHTISYIVSYRTVLYRIVSYRIILSYHIISYHNTNCIIFSAFLLIYWLWITSNPGDCDERSPSWEADSSSASQEILRILLNPKVHYRIHKISPLSLSWVRYIWFATSRTI